MFKPLVSIVLFLPCAFSAPLPQNPHLDKAKNVLLGFKDNVDDPNHFLDNWTDGSSPSKQSTSSTESTSHGNDLPIQHINPEDIDYPPRIPVPATFQPQTWTPWWTKPDYTLPKSVNGADLINSRPQWWWQARQPQTEEELCNGGWLQGC